MRALSLGARRQTAPDGKRRSSPGMSRMPNCPCQQRPCNHRDSHPRTSSSPAQQRAATWVPAPRLVFSTPSPRRTGLRTSWDGKRHSAMRRRGMAFAAFPRGQLRRCMRLGVLPLQERPTLPFCGLCKSVVSGTPSAWSPPASSPMGGPCLFPGCIVGVASSSRWRTGLPPLPPTGDFCWPCPFICLVRPKLGACRTRPAAVTRERG
jgi:hypothetical protein